ncbi:winged helix-turn-helix domain-containing protein [Cedecea sp. FDAARGOS_727]|uniref:winged helix-turn-helix domain-containing protein n=1 Tax=Cedecea sp. FDAARGOS_727 TaxID=2545798 RepID=UPI00143E7F7B|nr:winged helix-turn-helix domain-containing protein [Cedecea sp. FDAARGOS_727]QIX94443.1 winged helix-turn-helix domain-containing protein [Cedecea sp. FDAARGOS_727]
MTVPHLSLRAARNLHLAAQGLLQKPRRRARPSDISEAVSRMSLLQIDTINIVARSPYLVLFSRLGRFEQNWLDNALANGELIEYWAHEACFLPKQDFSLIRHRMLSPENMGWKYRPEWMAEHAEDIKQLLAFIEQNGPVRSADFEHPRKRASGWWEWKPQKKHLEGLFTAGKVMVTERRNFQRVYDLTHRVMPHWDDAVHLIDQQQAELKMLENSARSLGVFRPEWLADYYRLKNLALKPLLENWISSGSVIRVEVEKLGEMLLHHSLLPLLDKAQQNQLKATHSAVLSPFDPVVWDRRRAEALFDFSYRLECYTPAEKRRYGYFVLPLLHNGALVGRMDAKMHRKQGELEVISLYLEEGVKVTRSLVEGLRGALNEFALWQSATNISFGMLPEALRETWGPGWEMAPAG